MASVHSGAPFQWMQKVILVVGVGNFEKGAEVPPEYLEFLDALPEKGVQVVHVATATKAAETHPEARFTAIFLSLCACAASIVLLSTLEQTLHTKP